jgi:ankyrin repeat protein
MGQPMTSDRETFLSMARQGDYDGLSNTLARSPDAINWRDNNGFDALLSAASQGKTDAVELLLERGATLESKNDSGLTALMVSACNGHRNTSRFLIMKGASIWARDFEGRDIWRCVIENGVDEEIKEDLATWAIEKIYADDKIRKDELRSEIEAITQKSVQVKPMPVLKLKTPNNP